MLGLGSGPAELIIVELGWMLATKQDPLPPSGPAACEMKHEEELEEGLNIITVVRVMNIVSCTTVYTDRKRTAWAYQHFLVCCVWHNC